MSKQIIGLCGALVVVAAIMAVSQFGSFGGLTAAVGGGFDQFGYNEKARVFTGPADGVDRNLDGTVWGDSTYAKDKLVMKWNAAWDACNDAGNDDEDACAGACVNNEWNGATPSGSQEVWHYKIVWVGSASVDSPHWQEGGYPVWGN